MSSASTAIARSEFLAWPGDVTHRHKGVGTGRERVSSAWYGDAGLHTAVRTHLGDEGVWGGGGPVLRTWKSWPSDVNFIIIFQGNH